MFIKILWEQNETKFSALFFILSSPFHFPFNLSLLDYDSRIHEKYIVPL